MFLCTFGGEEGGGICLWCEHVCVCLCVCVCVCVHACVFVYVFEVSVCIHFLSPPSAICLLLSFLVSLPASLSLLLLSVALSLPPSYSPGVKCSPSRGSHCFHIYNCIFHVCVFFCFFCGGGLLFLYRLFHYSELIQGPNRSAVNSHYRLWQTLKS